jgi:hypothetical protein
MTIHSHFAALAALAYLYSRLDVVIQIFNASQGEFVARPGTVWISESELSIMSI